MKTIQKLIAMSIAMLITTLSFSQLNLAVQNTTNAAVNAAIGTNSVIQSTHTISAITKAGLDGAISKTAGLKTAVIGSAQAGLQTNQSTVTGNTTSGVSLGGNAGASMGMNVNAADKIQKIETSSSGIVRGEGPNGIEISRQNLSSAKPSTGASVNAKTESAASVKSNR